MVHIHRSINDIPTSWFSTLALPPALGCLPYYKALEESRCLSPAQGWTPQYITSSKDDHAYRFVPMFLKDSSSDDFSRDLPLAKAYEAEIKKSYYPKLQVCVPFVPIYGQKFYGDNVDPNADKAFFSEILRWSEKQNVKSLHVTFPDQAEYPLLRNLGFFSSQHALCFWRNRNYDTFADFLGALKSKYRSQIVGERKRIASAGYKSKVVTGDAIKQDHVDAFFDLFELTHHRKGWKMSFLNRDFFQIFSRQNPDRVVYFLVEEHGKTIAASCTFLENDMLCGRYWGSLTDDNFLHFEVMYYLPIEFCINHRIASMELGFQELHKVIRGFEPKSLQSFHYFFDDDLTKMAEHHLMQKAPIEKNIFR